MYNYILRVNVSLDIILLQKFRTIFKNNLNNNIVQSINVEYKLKINIY